VDRYAEFEKRFKKFSELETEKAKETNRLSNLRLISFLAGAAVSVWAFAKAGVLAGILTALAALAVFIYLIILHNRAADELAGLKCKAEINRRYMERLGTGWTSFDDCGMEFADPSHQYADDLDIFGPESLFQWICAANTFYGRRKLRDLLADPDKDPVSIKRRQEAVKELIGRLDFCQELQSEGMRAKGVSEDPGKLLEYTERQAGFVKKGLINIFYVLPFLLVLSFVLWALGGPVPLFIPVLLLTAQMVIFAAGFKKNAEICGTVYGMRKYLGAYADLLRCIENEDFSDGYLKELKKKLFTEELSSSASIRKLEGIVNAVDIKYSTVLYFLLNVILLWDYHCAFALEEWKEQYGANTRKWLEAAGEMEALASLAVIGHLHPEWAWPELNKGKPAFTGAMIGHPLIREEECVRNDFVLESGACIITGSNMSGKTTLLRTVGINLVLAYAGAPVFAQMLKCSVMDVFTSMRVHDDLAGGISTFYAELLRVKRIIDHSRMELPMIYLIDEIFMGTNSPDRITGARSVLKNLNREWIIGMISTHDFELCELEQESKMSVKNYHFTEKYVNNEIKFDYKLRSGRSTTTNAKYLMKMVGIDLEGEK
jgi:hypothetical protein